MPKSRPPLSPFALGMVFAVASAALFAIRPIFVKLVYLENVDSATLIFWRMLLSAPIYLVLLLWFLREPQRRAQLTTNNIAAICFAGLIGYFGASYFDLLGLQYVSAQLGRIILYSYPTMVVILGALFAKQTITLKTGIALLLTYSGISFIFGHDLGEFGSDVIIGGLWITGSAFLFAIYLIIAQPLIKGVGSRMFTAIALLAASAGIILYYLLSFPIEQASINSNAGIVAMIGPGFTSIFAVSILGESFTLYHLFGIALVLIGIAFLKD